MKLKWTGLCVNLSGTGEGGGRREIEGGRDQGRGGKREIEGGREKEKREGRQEWRRVGEEGNIYMAVPCRNEDYSIAYFNRIAAFKEPYH